MRPNLPAEYCLFDTTIGCCGIAWIESTSSGALPRVARIQLPEATPEATASRIAHGFEDRPPSPPPPLLGDLVARIQAHLRGDIQDFLDVRVDLTGVEWFAREVYQATRAIPAGRTTTYGALARRMGQPMAARAVGQALGWNPAPLIIPCHRVVGANGRPGGFSAHGGLETKERLLAIEGVPWPEGPGIAQFQIPFDQPIPG
jgi:methylated-DNA-[protein]-cysteine S-methyltransferase